MTIMLVMLTEAPCSMYRCTCRHKSTAMVMSYGTSGVKLKAFDFDLDRGFGLRNIGNPKVSRRKMQARG